MMDLQKLFDEGFEAVKSYVDRSFEAYDSRIEALEKRLRDMPAPKDGRDADPDQVAAIVRDQIKGDLDGIRATVASFPTPPELPDIPQMVDDALEARLGVEDMERSIEEVVRAVVAEIPVPKDGKDGLPGEKGDPGKDGADVADAMIDRDGNLMIALTDGRLKNLGPVVGRDGAPGADGRDGKDGLGFDDLDFEYDGEKTAHLKFIRGDQVKEFTLRMPVVIDRGVFKEGTVYQAGDGVTWAGSFWIAREDTAEKPDSAKGWRLAVKKGRDGRDARPAPATNKEPVRVGVPKGGE